MVDYIINAAFWIVVIYATLRMAGILYTQTQRKPADVRALHLLRRHLSPKQLETFDRWDYFDAIGNYTGRTYRILWHEAGFNYTIVRLSKSLLSPDGEFCLTVNGRLPRGDVVLAQKFAIETREADFLRTANYDENCSWTSKEVFPNGRPVPPTQPTSMAQWHPTSWTLTSASTGSAATGPSRWQPVAFTTRRGDA